MRSQLITTQPEWDQSLGKIFEVSRKGGRQKTLAGPVELTGVGLHTGVPAKLTLQPAPEDFGIRFAAADMADEDKSSHFEYRSDHTTSVQAGNRRFSCVEHLMGALHALGITNCRIAFHYGDEVPYLDGSARPILEELHRVGIFEQDAPAWAAGPTKTATFDFGQDVSIGVEPSDDFEITAHIDFPLPIGKQQGHWKIAAEDFIAEIGSARTFLKDSLDRVPYADVRAERLKGLPANASDCELITYSDSAYLTQRRSEHECLQHKVLDFIGDTYTSGLLMRGHFILNRPGHKSNLIFAHYLSQHRP